MVGAVFIEFDPISAGCDREEEEREKKEEKVGGGGLSVWSNIAHCEGLN